YQHDSNGDLIGVTSPPDSVPPGTTNPPASIVPHGRRIQYGYRNVLNGPTSDPTHNLNQIFLPVDADGTQQRQPFQRIAYDSNDRVVRIAYNRMPTQTAAFDGDAAPNPSDLCAGSECTQYSYTLQLYQGNYDVASTTVTDRNGNITDYAFPDHLGQVQQITVR